MATLTHRRLRLTLDCDKFDPPLDQRTRDIPRVYSGTDLSIEIGLFFAGEPVEVGPFASITCEVKDLVDNAAPPAGDPALMLKSTEEFDGTTNKQSWDDFTKAHAAFSFTNEETNLAPGKKWIVFSAVTDDGKVITLACGIIEFLQDGTGPLGEAPEPQESYQSTAAADAKYLHKANHLSEYEGDEDAKADARVVLDVLSEEDSDTRYLRKAEQLADLSDKEAARTSLELGSAATFNVPEFGDADTEQVVRGNDSRLTDARAPTTHTHPQSQVTNLVSDLAGKAAAAHTHSQADVTSLISDLAQPPAGPFLCSGGAAVALTIPDHLAWAFGADDFSLALNVLVPDWTPSAADQLLASKINGNTGWKLWLLTTGVLRLEFGNGTNFSTFRYDSTVAVTTVSGVADFRALRLGLSADRDGNLLFAVNGVQLGGAVSISASAAQSLTTSTSLLLLSDGTTHYPGRIHQFTPFNVALPVTDNTLRYDLARLTRGLALPQALRYGEFGDYFARYAAANAATFGAADANNTTSWTNVGTWVCSAQAGARDGGAGAYVLRITSGATPSSGVINAAVIRVHRSGQRLRVSFWARRSANGQTTIPFYIRAASGSTLVHTFTGLTTNWQSFSTIVTVPEGDSTRNECGLGMSAGIAQNEYLEVDDFQLTAFGATAHYDPASLNPCQWRDTGTGEAHSQLIPTTVQVLDFPVGRDFVVTRRFVAGTNEPSSTAATTKFMDLPPHAVVLAFHSKSATGYDASTTFDIGITGTQAKFASAINVAATTETYTASASMAKESRSAFTAVWIKRNQSVTVGDTTIDAMCRLVGGPLL